MTAPTLPLVTPTGVLLMTAEQIRDRGAWLAERRNGIGSSDVPAILDLEDAYVTALHVWHDKRGDDVDKPSEPALWGTLLEDVVAQEWCRRNRSVIEDMGLLARQGELWKRASLDRLVRECPLDPARRAVCALEVKCRSAYKATRWHADVPDDVLAQTTWQRHVTGLDHIHVAVLIGGNDYRQTVVRHDEAIEAYIVPPVTAFWEIAVGQGIAPAPNLRKPDRLIELDEQLHPDRVGEIGLTEIGAVMEYADLSAQRGAIERQLKPLRAQLGLLAEGHRYVKFAGELAYELAPVTRSSCDLEALAERHPDAYADCIRATTSHTLRIAKPYKAGA
jgi:putative phage-type endonuclease